MNTDIYDLEEVRALIKTDKAKAGAFLEAIRASLPEGQWTGWLRVSNIKYETALTCLRAHDPVKWASKTIPKPLKAPTVTGEIHEAARGFKAMMTKAEAEPDVAKSDKRRTVAFQHFRFVLAASNLPALMQMTPDEIIQLLRKI